MRLSDKDILAELARRKAEVEANAPPSFLDPAFCLQSEFITDPSKRKLLLCTRRSGKSFGDGLYLVKEAYEKPGVSCIYVALTRETAEKIMWKDVLKVINDRFKLGAKFNETKLTMTLKNGSVIYLLGIDSTEDEKRKLLGQKYKLAVIDEPQSMTIDLKELVIGVLGPAVADYRGTICMTGTPGNMKQGLYFELTNGQDPQEPGTWERQGWKGYRWTAFQNPYMAQQWGEEIEALRASSPSIDETPLFQQHYLGRWVVDDTKLVYRYLAGRNDFSTLPEIGKGKWHYVLGVDLGYNDPTAFVLDAYHDHDKTLYTLESSKKSQMDVTDVAGRIKSYMSRFDLDAIVIDNANKQAVVELEKRHDIPLVPADKTGKVDFIEIMNGEYIQGRIKLRPDTCSPLADEYSGLIWHDKEREGKIKKEEHPACANHCADAALYAWRYCYSYLSEALPPPRPQIYTEAWYANEVKQMEERAQAELDRVLETRKEGVGDSSEWEWWLR